MGFWRPRSWNGKIVWDVVDWFALAVAAIAGAFTALAAPADKPLPASLTAGFTILAGFAKYRYRRCDDSEKKAKAARDELAAQERETEMAALRYRYSDQARRMVRAILAHMREHFFEQEGDREKYKHRVTLFVCKESQKAGTRKKHLAIYAREGLYSDSMRTWHLDENVPQNCRGVAGKIWFHNTTEFAAANCDWPEDGDPIRKTQYAASLHITVAEAETLNVKSKVFAGSVVMVRGGKWGVLLVDSLKDWLSNDPRVLGRQKKRLERYATLIRRVLEEAEV